MNISASFAEYMEDILLGTVGTDIEVGGVPQDAPEACWWVIPQGGGPEQVNQTGEMLKNYVLNVYYRDTNQESVYNSLQLLEETVNSGNCTQLDGFDTISMQATSFATDEDIDSEERTVGLVQVTIKVYSDN